MELSEIYRRMSTMESQLRAIQNTLEPITGANDAAKEALTDTYNSIEVLMEYMETTEQMVGNLVLEKAREE